MAENIYLSGQYEEKNPTWHVDESPWKVRHILQMMKRHDIVPNTVFEVGCGAGEVLRLLQANISDTCTFSGYDISPQAIAMCNARSNERLHCKLADFRQEKDAFADLILVLDVIEHLEDYFGFLRDIKPKSRYKLFHIPLEISVQSVLQGRIFIKNRDTYGHLHHFTKETALRTLKDAGYEVLDTSYLLEYEWQTAPSQMNFKKLARKFFFSIHKDWAARIFGGCRLLVLAQ